MIFLLNMNVSPRLLHHLKNEGHNGWHVAELKMQRATDRQILKFAEEKDAVLLTCDLDYGEIIAIEGKKKPSLILFRTSNIHPDHLSKLLKAY